MREVEPVVQGFKSVDFNELFFVVYDYEHELLRECALEDSNGVINTYLHFVRGQVTAYRHILSILDLREEYDSFKNNLKNNS